MDGQQTKLKNFLKLCQHELNTYLQVDYCFSKMISDTCKAWQGEYIGPIIELMQ